MSTPNYIALRDKIRSWSNRDEDVLSNDVLRDCIQFAADKAYRTLQVPSIEKTYTYTINAAVSGQDGEPDYDDWIANNYLEVPPELTKFIYVRKISGNGITVPNVRTDRQGVVFNTKIHSRSYADPYFIMDNGYYFAVQGDKIRIPNEYAVADGDVFEVAYYGRLSAMDEEYAVSDENLAEGIYATAPNNATGWSGSILDGSEGNAITTDYEVQDSTSDTGLRTETTPATGKTLFDDYIDLANLVAGGGTKPTENLSSDYLYEPGEHNDPEGDLTLTTSWSSSDLQRWWNVYGIEIPNWLRDDQEKVLLFGTLMEVGKYLADSEMEARYAKEFEDEVRLLNLEEQFRITSGANTTLGFQGHGLI